MAIAYEYRPGVLYLNITNRCTNDCTFCVRQGPGFCLGGVDMRLTHEPDSDEVLRAIADAEAGRGRAFREVVFCGFGEPTLRLEVIRDVGRTLREGNVSVRLNTNGHAELLTEGDPVEALDGAVDVVSISLNAPDGERYLELCEPSFGEGAYKALLRFARACVARGTFRQVVLTAVSFTLGPEEIERCEELADEIGADFRLR